MLELTLTILPFVFLILAFAVVPLARMFSIRRQIQRQFAFMALLLALQGFAYVLLNIHAYRVSEAMFDAAGLERRRTQEIMNGVQFKQQYLDDRMVFGYAAIFLTCFCACLFICYSKTKRKSEPSNLP